MQISMQLSNQRRLYTQYFDKILIIITYYPTFLPENILKKFNL